MMQAGEQNMPVSVLLFQCAAQVSSIPAETSGMMLAE